MPICFSSADGANVREHIAHGTSSIFSGPGSMTSSESQITIYSRNKGQNRERESEKMKCGSLVQTYNMFENKCGEWNVPTSEILSYIIEAQVKCSVLCLLWTL